MGVRRLFSRGGQKISREGTNLILPKKTTKRYYFSQSLKTYYFGRPGGGARAPLPPSRRPCLYTETCMRVLKNYLMANIHIIFRLEVTKISRIRLKKFCESHTSFRIFGSLKVRIRNIEFIAQVFNNENFLYRSLQLRVSRKPREL